MLRSRVNSIISVLDLFTGLNGEPKGNQEIYLLKAMWVMLLSEFESSLKDTVEEYIDRIKTQPVENIHFCVLLNSFIKTDEELTIGKMVNLYKKDPSKISYENFTRNKKPKNKKASIEKMYNSLGIFFSENELERLKYLDSLCSTRDSIAHGDTNVSITCSELRRNIEEIIHLYDLLKNKLI